MMQTQAGSGSKNPGLVTLIGGALVAIGVFLPWATVGPISLSGMDTDDGKMALVLGILLAAAGVVMLAKASRGILLGFGITALVLGALQALFSVIDLSDFPAEVSVGFGLYLTLFGAVVAAIGGILGIMASRKMPRASAMGAAAPPPPPAPPV